MLVVRVREYRWQEKKGGGREVTGTNMLALHLVDDFADESHCDDSEGSLGLCDRDVDVWGRLKL